jgi:hypothetical protein
MLLLSAIEKREASQFVASAGQANARNELVNGALAPPPYPHCLIRRTDDAAIQIELRRSDERQERAVRNLVESFAAGAPGVGSEHRLCGGCASSARGFLLGPTLIAAPLVNQGLGDAATTHAHVRRGGAKEPALKKHWRRHGTGERPLDPVHGREQALRKHSRP